MEPVAPGLLVTFEGIEGTGKTTQIDLCARWLREAKGRTVISVREPGGTPLGETLRRILLEGSKGDVIGARAELLLYCASRAQLVDRIILPALESGSLVLADRYGDASIAYQGAGRNLGEARTLAVVDFATGGLRPDRTYLLDLPPTVGLHRVLSRGAPDRLEAESLEFHERVRLAYRLLAESEPGRFLVLDATRSVETLAAEIRGDMERLLSGCARSGPEQGRGGRPQR